MWLNDVGRLMASVWHDVAVRFPTVALDAFVVMPNHVHGIVVVSDDAEGAAARVASAGGHNAPGHRGGEAPLVGAAVVAPVGATTRIAPTLGDVIGAFKSLCTVG